MSQHPSNTRQPRELLIHSLNLELVCWCCHCVQVWMLILRYLAGVMVWITIATVDLALIGCTLYAYNMAGILTKAGQWGATIAAQLPAGSDPTGAAVAREWYCLHCQQHRAGHYAEPVSAP